MYLGQSSVFIFNFFLLSFYYIWPIFTSRVVTDKQYRDLLVTSMVILLIGTFAYHYLEGWDFIDSLYFSVITLTTVGYGDFSPQTSGSKIFTIFYIFIGLGMILSFLHTLFDHFNKERQEYKKPKE